MRIERRWDSSSVMTCAAAGLDRGWPPNLTRAVLGANDVGPL
ncbi:MAG: hypothetical protein KatS3mg077_2614 [Candidatus Binatia bacterium]|nr:MAG: hypothetical protein KatS3mg077_2614 [Candidatus Binatia bacterium]